MITASSTALILSAFILLGNGIYTVLGYFIALALALMVFYFGWSKLRTTAFWGHVGYWRETGIWVSDADEQRWARNFRKSASSRRFRNEDDAYYNNERARRY